MTDQVPSVWGMVRGGRVQHLVRGGKSLCSGRPIAREAGEGAPYRQCRRCLYRNIHGWDRFQRVRLVYLLHFDTPYQHARHYLGSTDQLDERLLRHNAGTGARLLAVAKANGVTWRLARTWVGDRNWERRKKKQGGASRYCPICREESRVSQPQSVLPLGGHLRREDCAA